MSFLEPADEGIFGEQPKLVGFKINESTVIAGHQLHAIGNFGPLSLLCSIQQGPLLRRILVKVIAILKICDMVEVEMRFSSHQFKCTGDK